MFTRYWTTLPLSTNHHLLFLDPGSRHVFQGLAGALDSKVQSIFEAFGMHKRINRGYSILKELRDRTI